VLIYKFRVGSSRIAPELKKKEEKEKKEGLVKEVSEKSG
jgi:hypothetical protein